MVRNPVWEQLAKATKTQKKKNWRPLYLNSIYGSRGKSFHLVYTYAFITPSLHLHYASILMINLVWKWLPTWEQMTRKQRQLLSFWRQQARLLFQSQLIIAAQPSDTVEHRGCQARSSHSFLQSSICQSIQTATKCDCEMDTPSEHLHTTWATAVPMVGHWP